MRCVKNGFLARLLPLIGLLSLAGLQAKTTEWVDLLPATGNAFDKGYDIATSYCGEAYVVSTIDNGARAKDIQVIRYDEYGFRTAFSPIDAGGAGDDIAKAICIDPEGTVWTAGSGIDQWGNETILTIAYDRSGAHKWTLSYDFSGANQLHEVVDIEADPFGNVYVLATAKDPAFQDWNYLLLKYATSNGGLLRQRQYDAGFHGDDFAKKLAVSHLDGEIYVAGESYSPQGNRDWRVIRLHDIALGTVWQDSYINNWLDDHVNDIAISADGTVYVCGTVGLGQGKFAYRTARYDSDLGRLNHVDYTTSDNSVATALTIDANGFVVVTGYSRSAPGSTYDILTIRYDADLSNELPFTPFNAFGSPDDFAADIAADQYGNVLVLGHSTYNAVAIKYSPQLNGITLWSPHLLSGPGTGYFEGCAAAFNRYGKVFVTGSKTDVSQSHSQVLTYLFDRDLVALPPQPVFGADLWARNTDWDDGREPYTWGGAVFASPDIWVRRFEKRANALGNHRFEHEHEDTDLQHTAGAHPSYIYVKVRNRGCMTVENATLKVYWSKASTGLDWPNHWVGFDCPHDPLVSCGDELSDCQGTIVNIALPPIAPGQEVVQEIEWCPPDPGNYPAGDARHFCLLARIISVDDPMSNEQNNVHVVNNVLENNNIIWKNIIVEPSDGRYKTAPTWQPVRVRMTNGAAGPIRLGITTEDQDHFLNYGSFTLDIGDELFNRWVSGGQVAEGSYTLDAANNFVLASPNDLLLQNIAMQPAEEFIVAVSFNVFEHLPINEERSFSFDLRQYALDPGGVDYEEVGGERFALQVIPPESALLTPTDVPEPAQPGSLQLLNLWPDPSGVGEALALSFRLNEGTKVTIAVYDTEGRLVRELTRDYFAAGEHRISWDGLDSDLVAGAAGVYYIRLQAAGQTLSRQFVRTR